MSMVTRLLDMIQSNHPSISKICTTTRSLSPTWRICPLKKSDLCRHMAVVNVFCEAIDARLGLHIESLTGTFPWVS